MSVLDSWFVIGMTAAFVIAIGFLLEAVWDPIWALAQRWRDR